MATLELLTIPGMDYSKDLGKLARKSKERMDRAARSSRLAAGVMSLKRPSTRK